MRRAVVMACIVVALGHAARGEPAATGGVCQAFYSALAREVADGHYDGIVDVLRPFAFAVQRTKDPGNLWPEAVPQPQELINYVAPYVRLYVCERLILNAQQQDTPTEMRVARVELVAKKLDDADIGPELVKALVVFDAADFSPRAREMVKKQFVSDEKNKAWILLMGKVDAGFCLKHVETLLNLPLETKNEPLLPEFANPQWAATLVSARTGDKKSLQKVLEVLDRGIADGNYWSMAAAHLFPDLEYVRRPEVVNGVVRCLNIDNDRDFPHGDDSPFVRQAVAVMSRMLDGFPPVESGRRWRKSLEECRRWTSAQRQWVFRPRSSSTSGLDR